MQGRTIYKYPFEIQDIVEITMPAGAEILKVEMQGIFPCMWAIVQPTEKERVHQFRIVGTGLKLPDDCHTGNHVGTFQQGPFVWHIFKIN